MKFGVALLFAALVAGGVAYVAMQNTYPVPVDLVLAQYPAVPVWALVLISVAIGAGGMFLLFTLPVFRLRIDKRRKTKRIAELEQEIHGLRTLPLTEDEGAKTEVLET